MPLPLTLPLENHLTRQVNLTRRPAWAPARDSHQTVRVIEIEMPSDAEEAALRHWLLGLAVRT